MNSLAKASAIASKAAADLEELQQYEHDPREIRVITGRLYDACGLLMRAAGDLECGLVD